MTKKTVIRRFLAALFAALVLTGLASPKPARNLLYRVDQAASDALYQQTGLQNREIAVFGIDQETVDALGPVTGLRGAMAQAIENLNAVPEDRPLAIGLDIMYSGESADGQEADRLLAETAGKYDNIVVAADAKFGNKMVETDEGTFSVQQNAVLGWYEPYEALRRNVRIGHVNQSVDTDGILRHVRLSVDIPEVGTVDSLGKVLYDLWCEKSGSEPNAMPETTASGYYYLPFSADEGGYSDGFSFLDLVRGEVDPYYYRGKIVLIGPTAAGMQDDYFTALNHSAKMSGVNIQANMVEAFRNGFFPKELAKTAQLFLLFLTAFLLALFLWERRPILSLLVCLAVSLLWLGICRLAYRYAGVILHPLWIPVAAGVLLVASVALNYLHAQRERQRVTDTFGHYIDPAVRDQLLSKGAEALELGGRTCEIAVLFVDVRGFTAMSEALDAQSVVEIVNRYLTLTTDCIMKNHGTLDKFVGDCTMAIWNAPVEQDDPVYLACQAAVDMVAGSEALGKELMERYGRTVSFGIGVHYGPAVVGNIGAPKRMDYTAIGDTVNTAARLEANAPGGTILISRAVADILGDRAECTSLGDSIRLKGKAEGFEVIRLDRLHG